MKYVWISILLVFISCVCVVHWREEVKKIPEVWTNRRGIKEALLITSDGDTIHFYGGKLSHDDMIDRWTYFNMIKSEK